MCPPGCLETVRHRLTRRSFFKGSTLALAAAGSATLMRPLPSRAQSRSFTRVVDLTHTLGEDFPTYFGKPQLTIETLSSIDQDGFNMKQWTLVEHTGTHMDAPIHFSADGLSADEVPVERLVVPLAVVDIAAKAAETPDAQLTPDDITAWEGTNGPLPENCCVAMHSGWGRHVASPMYRNVDEQGVMHFPGVHPEAADMLMRERTVVGLAVDTLSLDYGASKDFATHYAWLPSNRWGMESVAKLDGLPATGATIVAGGPKIRGATGGPSRVLALVG